MVVTKESCVWSHPVRPDLSFTDSACALQGEGENKVQVLLDRLPLDLPEQSKVTVISHDSDMMLILLFLSTKADVTWVFEPGMAVDVKDLKKVFIVKKMQDAKIQSLPVDKPAIVGQHELVVEDTTVGPDGYSDAHVQNMCQVRLLSLQTLVRPVWRRMGWQAA